jgi:hypothetical protein
MPVLFERRGKNEPNDQLHGLYTWKTTKKEELLLQVNWTAD